MQLNGCELVASENEGSSQIHLFAPLPTAMHNAKVKAPQEFSNQGCGQRLPDGSFGPEFNKNGGSGNWQKHDMWFVPHGTGLLCVI